MFTCSFCSTSESDSETIVAGPEVNICDECIALCVAVLRDGNNPKAFQKVMDVINEPREETVMYYSCREGDCLFFNSIHDAVASELDDIQVSDWKEELIVFSYLKLANDSYYKTDDNITVDVKSWLLDKPHWLKKPEVVAWLSKTVIVEDKGSECK